MLSFEDRLIFENFASVVEKLFSNFRDALVNSEGKFWESFGEMLEKFEEVSEKFAKVSEKYELLENFLKNI